MLDNWTGILGAVVLVTGVGFLGVYTALQVTPPVRFAMISAFAGALFGGHLYLQKKAFAAQLHVWLQSSAAAIFLFACVGAVSVPGLQWVQAPMSYALLLLGVGANLWLAWKTGRQTIATLHGVLSLVALTVIPPTLLTLGAAAAVTAFSIGITWRQQWKYQLLLSIVSFFAFHQYWYYHLAGAPDSGLRLGAMALVLLVGVAAAVVQYRRVYAANGFDQLLFTAHVLNWTCLGINLYQYSTGSVWKTIPLGLGAALTFGVARVARRLGIRWLYRTDSILALLLALFAAFSLQGWHATGTLVLLFMFLETLLIGFVMVREGEHLVFRVATVGGILAGLALVLLNIAQLPITPDVTLHRNALLLLLAGGLGASFFRLVQPQLAGVGGVGIPSKIASEIDAKTDSESEIDPEISSEVDSKIDPENDDLIISRQLHQGFGGVVGLLYAAVAALLARALFGPDLGGAATNEWGLIATAIGAAGTVFGLAWWLRSDGPSWFRSLHLMGGQLLLIVALLGLHAPGLSWPAALTVVWVESLLLTFALVRAGETLAGRVVLLGGLMNGVALLLRVAGAPSIGAVLHPDAALLLLAGATGAVAYFRLRERLMGTLAVAVDKLLLLGTGALVGGVFAGVAATLARALFSAENPPVVALIGGSVGAAAVAFGLAWWHRTAGGWFRSQLLLMGQLLLTVGVLGLHEMGLSWPVTLTLLYLEFLLMTVALARAISVNGTSTDSFETLPHRVVLFGALVLAGALPILVYHLDPDRLTDSLRAALLVGAAVGTTGALALLDRLRVPFYDALPLNQDPPYRLRLLGLAVGVLLLAAFGLVYTHTWAVWVAGGVGAAWLLLRRAWPVPGLWEGLLVAVIGACGLEWSYTLSPRAALDSWAALGHLAPLLAPIGAGLAASWWPEGGRHIRGPWLYLLGLHLALATWAVLARHGHAWPVLTWTALAGGFGVAATIIGRRLPDEAARVRAGRPERYLRHLMFALVGVAVAVHLTELVPSSSALLLGWPARRLTAVALLLVLAGMAWQRSPDGSTYRSWHFQALFPELTLLFLAFTISWETRIAWEAPAWLAIAFGLTMGGRVLPARLRRVQVYGIGFYWLTVAVCCYVALRYLAPGQLLSEMWLTTASAVGLLFAYTAVALGQATRHDALPMEWPPVLAPLARLGTLTPRQLVLALLYPAFVALTVLLVRSFDRSVLTVLLMLEVVAVFVSSLVLRRPDLRYAALLGVAVCLVRLVFFDLSQRGTVTRAVVFILMGLLLLGMNALYARFKDRFKSETGLESEENEGEKPA